MIFSNVVHLHFSEDLVHLWMSRAPLQSERRQSTQEGWGGTEWGRRARAASLEEHAGMIEEIIQGRQPFGPLLALFHSKKQPVAQLQ